MFNQETVARPYAKAAFDFAVEHNSIERWHKTLIFLNQVARDNQVKTLLTGFLSPEKLANLIVAICDDRLDQHGQNFIKILAENGRLAVLPQILTQFAHLTYEHKCITEVEVTSSSELNQERLDKIQTTMEKRLSGKVKLNCKIDPTIVAGIIIRAGDMVIDGSVRGRLNRLSDALQT